MAAKLNYEVDADGIYRPSSPVRHRDEEYDQTAFDTLWAMQEKHFWYRGRHRFLLGALDRYLPSGQSPRSAVDLGGGVGGWVRYLADRRPSQFSPLALADSSETALGMAGDVLSAGVARYQIDLMNLGWESQWDYAFLLDVIEHLPDDVQALHQAAQALKPGGLLFVTTPALKHFWSYNDDLVHHLRRYNRNDFAVLAQAAGLELLDARYFMFLLSPLYWLARQRPGVRDMSVEQQRQLLNDSHKVPSASLNLALTAAFGAETPLGHWLRFPWGTSILGVFRKP
jgi:SAM-dependent methyltransferase